MSNYHAFEQMANLNRQDARDRRVLSSPTRQDNVPTPAFIAIHDTVEIFRTYMPPFLKKLMENLSIKYSKIACAIRNLKAKLNHYNEILPGQELPAELKFQQKYYDSLATAEIKEAFVQNLLTNKKAVLSAKIAENEALYGSRYDEMKKLVEPFSTENCGSDFLKDCKITWAKVLDSYIQIQICTMTAKAQQDQLKKDRKREKFDAKKEEMSKVKVVTIKEFERLTAELKSLKISAKKAEKSKTKPKNSKGEKTVGKGPSPKTNQDQKKLKSKGKAKTQSKGSGNTKGTSTKRR
jgi:hypothetical protein